MNASSPLRGAVAGPVRTDYGARTELRLEHADGAGARYEARWFLGVTSKATAGDLTAPDAHGLATVSAQGDVQIELRAGQLPDWLRSFTEKLLRLAARSAQEGRFPRRLTRWRDDRS